MASLLEPSGSALMSSDTEEDKSELMMKLEDEEDVVEIVSGEESSPSLPSLPLAPNSNRESPLLGDTLFGAEGGIESDDDCCPYCHQTFRQPRLLKCLHALCEDCVIALLEGHASAPGDNSSLGGGLEEELEVLEKPGTKPPPGVIRCPVCRSDSQVGNDARFAQFLLLDFVTVNLMDSANLDTTDIACESCKTKDNAVARCQDCSSYLCPNCVQAHQYMRCFDGHTVVKFEDIKKSAGNGAILHRPIPCTDHPNDTLRYLCLTCQAAVCNECMTSFHKVPPHRVVRMDETVTNQLKNILKNLVKAGEDKAQECEKATQHLETKMEELKTRVEIGRESINEAFDSFEELLAVRRKEMLKELEEAGEKHENNVREVCRAMGSSAEKIFDACRFTNRLIEHGNGLELLISRQAVSDQITHLLHGIPNSNAPVNLRYVFSREEFKDAIKKGCGSLESDLLQPHLAPPPCSRDQNWRNALDDLVRRISQPRSADSGIDQLDVTGASVVSNIRPSRNDLSPVASALSSQSSGGAVPVSSSDNFGHYNSHFSEEARPRGDRMDAMTKNLVNLALSMSGPDTTDNKTQRNSYQPQNLARDDLGMYGNQQMQQEFSASSGLPNFGNTAHQSSFFQSRASAFTTPADFHSGLSGYSEPMPAQPNLAQKSLSHSSHQLFQHLSAFSVPPGSGHGSGRSSAATPVESFDPMSYSQFGAGNLPHAASAFASLGNPLLQLQYNSRSQLPSVSSLAGEDFFSSSPAYCPPSSGAHDQVSPYPGASASTGRSQSTMNHMDVRYKFGTLGPAPGQFNSPHGFCLGFDEELVIADTNNHRIQVFTEDGTIRRTFGLAGKEDGQLWYPRKVSTWRLGGTQKYIVCDRGNERSRMQVFSRSGEFIKKIVIRFMDIVAGLAVDARNRIVIVDSVSPTVFRIDERGELDKWFDCSNYMKEPSDISVHGDEYFICDFKGHCVCVFSDEGHFLRKIGNEQLTSFPNGIDISDMGDVLIGDSHGNRFHVSIFKKSGEYQAEFECPTVKVSRCCGLRITKEGLVVTLAKNNHHVLVLNTLYVQ